MFFTLGGISWFSNERGWAADNVKAFEVHTFPGLLITFLTVPLLGCSREWDFDRC